VSLGGPFLSQSRPEQTAALSSTPEGGYSFDELAGNRRMLAIDFAASSTASLLLPEKTTDKA